MNLVSKITSRGNRNVKFLRKNKIIEKCTLLGAIASGGLMIGGCHVYWILNKLGIHLANDVMQNIIDAVSSGAGLGTAFATIAGITLPAWALAAAGALGATAA